MGSQLSSIARVSQRDVDEAKRDAAKAAESRDSMNKHPRREEITKEIRVQEDKLKSISEKIEQDTKSRDQLRLKSDEQNEIDMLERQVNQEYDVLTELLKENSFLISRFPHCNVTREDPVAPVGVLHNNVRNQLKLAEDEVEHINSSFGDVQKKVSEKKALLTNHKQRFQLLQQKKSVLFSPDGGVQKIKSVTRAILRLEKDNVDTDKINEDSTRKKKYSWHYSVNIIFIGRNTNSYSHLVLSLFHLYWSYGDSHVYSVTSWFIFDVWWKSREH